jgi:tripartite-type tricarboxylate transporter receptor subunit TctC
MVFAGKVLRAFRSLPFAAALAAGTVLAQAGTPRPIINRLNAELVKIMQMPELKERLAAMATDPVTSTPEEFADLIKQEISRWAKVVREAGLKAD